MNIGGEDMLNLMQKNILPGDVEPTPYNDFYEMLSFLDDLYDTSRAAENMNYNPIRVGIKETDMEYLITADLMGVKEDDVQIEYKNKNLLITVERTEEKEDEGGDYLKKETKREIAQTTIYLDNVKEDGMTKKYDEGVLKIKLFKEKPDGYKDIDTQ